MPTVVLEHLPAQDDFFHADEPAVAFVGGLGTGKTHIASDWVLAGVPEYPEARHFIFSNTYPQLVSGTMYTFFERCDDWGVTYVDRVRDQHLVYLTYPNGATGKVEVWSVDKPINFKSLEICRAWIDEAQAWNKDAYDKVVGRMRGTTTQRRLYPDMPLLLRLTANPPHTLSHWLVEACTVPDPKTGQPPIKLITAATWDNPFLPQEYIDRMLSNYDPELAEIELGGKFGDIGRGRVFRRFSRKLHLLSDEEVRRRGLPPLEYDPAIPVCWSHDFNIDPMCSILFQWRRINVDGYKREVMYVLDELRIRDAVIDSAVKEFLTRKPACEIAKRRGLILYGDASGNQRSRQTGESDWATLRSLLASHGYAGESRVDEANPDRKDRFDAANLMLEDAKGLLGVVIHPRCKFLVQDAERMYFKPGTVEVEIYKPKAGELPDASRMFTHLGDAWSYPIYKEYPIVEERNQDGGSTLR